MGPITPLVIHRSEWDRLKNQANPNTEIKKVPWSVDIEGMTAQSQKWINSWPDSVQGHINKVTKMKKKLHLAELAEVEAFNKKEKHKHTAENLRRARDMIFERTGYGKELLSALFESKCLDEREIQLKFKKEIQEKEKEMEEAKEKIDNIMYAEFEKGESNRLLQKQKEKSDAECNKMMADMKREETKRAAEIKKNNRLEDAQKIEKLRRLQVLEEKYDHRPDKEAVKIFEKQNKTIQEMREKRENLDQVLAGVWRQHQDRIRRKEKLMFNQIHKEKQDTRHFKENYELVQRLQEEEEKKYNDFIDKGVNKMERRLREQEGQALKIYQQHISKDTQPSKTLRESENCGRTLSVDRQSFPITTCSKLESKLLKGTPIESPLPPPRPQFLAPSKTLQAALKERQAQAGGWSGAGAAHARFERHAAAALREATHKHLVRKVIHSYRKQNNSKDQQIPNY